MRRTLPSVTTAMVAITLVLAGLQLSGAATAQPNESERVSASDRKPTKTNRCRSATFRGIGVPGARVTGVKAVQNRGAKTRITHPVATAVEGKPFCEVEIALTHGKEGTAGLPADDVHVWVWLPKKWNGRLQAIGGGGTRATNGPTAMAPALENGYAVTASDSGISVENPRTHIFLEGTTFNWQLFENWSYRGVHDNAVIAKKVVRSYYHKPARYAYWNGCSNGGRQGLEMAQRFPGDFDGVLAAAPAIYGAERLNMTMSWPAFLQNDAFGDFIPECKMAAMTEAVLEECDGLDGVNDGLVSNPRECDYTTALESLVGAELECGRITAEEVDVVIRIFEGPRTDDGHFVWYGHTPGVDLTGGAIRFHDGWAIQNFIKHDPNYDWTTSTTEELIEEFGPAYRGRLDILSSSDPVLEPFANRGGKLLMWHGLADGLFPADQSIHYYDEVRMLSGDSTGDFFRLFLAPGVDHCGGGAGPSPEDPLAALVRWVEKGKAPKTLPAVKRDDSGDVVLSRDLCAYPAVEVYDGTGEPTLASNFSCGEAFPDPAS